VSPRRNYPKKRRAPDQEEDVATMRGLVVSAPAGWKALVITKERALKEYRCPGCDHEVRVGVQHVVAWRVGDDHHRRHWHTGCWANGARVKR
jgi:hypothetical protein